jgi:sec-independent protein translocase protein TatB
VFDSLGWGEMSALLVLALFVFGPDKLPSVASQLAGGVRRARALVTSLTDDLKQDLGPELGELAPDLRDLSPRRLLGQLLDDETPSTGPTGPGSQERG